MIEAKLSVQLSVDPYGDTAVATVRDLPTRTVHADNWMRLGTVKLSPRTRTEANERVKWRSALPE
jgi:hypothetical protein